MNEHFCGAQCFMDENCVSYNFRETGANRCELNNATNFAHPDDLKIESGTRYRGTKAS